MQKITTKLDRIEKRANMETDILKIEPLANDYVKLTRYNGKREMQDQIQMLKEDFIDPLKLKELLQNRIIIDLSQTTEKNIDEFINTYFITKQHKGFELLESINKQLQEHNTIN